MGRTFRRFGLLLALAAVTSYLQACGGCSGNTSLLTQKIDPPGTLSPEDLEDPDTDLVDLTPGKGVPCVTATDCDDGFPCTDDACVEGFCDFIALPADICCEDTPLQAFGFDDDSADDLDADNPFGGANWDLTQTRAVSAPSSLYFGNTATQTLGDGHRVIGALRLPPVTLPPESDSHLTMRLFVDIEAGPHRDELTLFADVLGPNGAVVDAVLLMSKDDIPNEAYAGFALLDLALESLAGATIRLRLDFDSVQAPNPSSEGIFIDDIEIATLCPETPGGDELPTLGDAQPDDDTPGDLGTDDGTGSDDDLGDDDDEEGDDDDLGDEDDAETLPGGTLVSGGPANPCDAPDAHEGCCTSDDDCDDGNPATINVCEGAECVAGWNPDACTDDAQCDDGEACTLDACVDGLCAYEGTFGTACCEEGVQPLADFDSESLQGLFVTDNLETGVFWRTDPTRSTSGDFALYCGDPVDQTYGIGERVKSSATTPILALPVGGNTRLVFDLFMLTRPSPDVDVFQVFVLRHGVLLSAWSSKLLPGGNTVGFNDIEVDLSSFAGQEIQLRFVFDSVDANAPMVEGTYVDSLRLETTCF